MRLPVNNQRGTTIIELILYMVAGMLVIAVALSAITNVSKGYVKARTTTNLQLDGRQAINMLARDLTNIGAKYYLSYSANTFTRIPIPQATREGIGAVNSASPEAKASLVVFSNNGVNNRSFDTLEYYAMNLESNTVVNGTPVFTPNPSTHALRKVIFVRRSDSSLVQLQSNKVSAGDWKTTTADYDTTVISKGVVALKFFFSADGAVWYQSDNVANRSASFKYTKVFVVIQGQRQQGASFGVRSLPMVAGTETFTFDTPSDQFQYRLYEAMVPIPNNGIVQ